MMEERTSNCGTGENIDGKRAAVETFRAALGAVDPYACVKAHVGSVKSVFERGGFRKVLLVGFGKAAYPMAKAYLDHAGEMVDSGIMITQGEKNM